MGYRVRFVEADVQYQRLKPEIDAIMQDVLARGDLILRKDLKQFEQNLADYCGTKFAIGVNSGFHALHLSLIAAGIETGDEVIVPAHTFVACESAIVLTGAIPILAEVGVDYNLDMASAESLITPKTKAIMPVHLNGRMCEMDRLMDLAERHNLFVIEDAAQALGASYKGKRAGSIGLTGCFSFYPFKALGAYGDGGAITTNNEEIATITSRLRYNGEDRTTREFHYHGFTCLLDNLQAAILDVKLRHFPHWVERRRQLSETYREELGGVGDLRLPHFTGEEYFDTYQNYVIRTKYRDALVNHLKEQGVETIISWPKPMWEHADLNLGKPVLPETESICREVVSLPLNSEISDESVHYVIEAVRGFFLVQ